MLKLLKALFGKKDPEDSKALDALYEAEYFARYKVTTNSAVIRCIDPNGKVDSIKWDAISEVSMMHKAFFISEGRLLNKDGSLNKNYRTISIPVGATGQDDLLGGMLSVLDGFDKAALLNALGNATELFVLWERKNSKI